MRQVVLPVPHYLLNNHVLHPLRARGEDSSAARGRRRESQGLGSGSAFRRLGRPGTLTKLRVRARQRQEAGRGEQWERPGGPVSSGGTLGNRKPAKMDEQRNAMTSRFSGTRHCCPCRRDQRGRWGDQHAPGETVKACASGPGGPDGSRQSRRHRLKSWVDGGRDRKHSRRQEAVGTDQGGMPRGQLTCSLADSK